MSYQTITLQTAEGVATLLLNRPEKKNALDLQIREEIGDAVARLRADEAIRAVILTGAGGDFCAGGDIRSMAAVELSAEAGRQRMRGVHAWLRDLMELDRPVICAVDGAAFGAGFGLALVADFIIATPQARFCASFQRMGLVADSGLFYTLPRMVGLQRARELLLSARELDAATARDWGIVSEIVPPEKLIERARAIAGCFVGASGVAVALTKAALGRTFESDLASMLESEATMQGIAFSTPYHRAAARRFLDKQPPLFQWPKAPETA